MVLVSFGFAFAIWYHTTQYIFFAFPATFLNVPRRTATYVEVRLLPEDHLGSVATLQTYVEVRLLQEDHLGSVATPELVKETPKLVKGNPYFGEATPQLVEANPSFVR